MSQMVTTGCVNVEFRRICNDLEVEVENKNTPLSVSTENVNGIVVSTQSLYPIGHVEVENKNKELNVTFGIVCSMPSGFTILYAYDGALITIDNNYLIVQNEK